MSTGRQRFQSAMLSTWRTSRNAAKALFAGTRRLILACWRASRNAGQAMLVGARQVLLSARFLILCVLLLIAALVAYYALSDRYTPFTTDAYVQAYVIQVAPRVEGEIVRVNVVENQAVRKGDLLFEIDPRPFEHRVDLLEAKLVEATQQVAEMESEVAASEAEDARLMAQERYARAVHEQETQIYKQLATTQRKYLDAVQRYEAAKAERQRSQAVTRKARQILGARIGGQHAIVAEIKAQLADAKLNLGWTQVYASAQGYVTNVQLRVGSYVHIGVPVMTCIDGDQWWVVANYRENSLEYLKPGQRVELSFDTYPGRLFPGTVQLVGWGVSGGQASPSGKLPAVNEPQNWIRLAQRFQVWVISDMPEEYPLRVGATASVAVYPREKFWLNRITHAWHRIVSAFDYLR
jgi:multidrug resistance efflux pump